MSSSLDKPKRKILIVDDEPALRTLFLEEFQLLNYETFEAANGDDAMRIFTRERPHAVLSDMKMPGTDGVSLLKYIRSTCPETLVYFMTGNVDGESTNAERLGVQWIFEKPFGVLEIPQRIDQDLEKIGK